MTLVANKTYQGKVRDCIFKEDNKLEIITSDRLSAFDRVLTTIPHKGQVLNQLNHWWMEQTSHIIPNGLIKLIDSRTSLYQTCEVFPIEFIVRGYLTGTTSTSIWTLYQQGERQFGDLVLPDGMQKNQALPHPIITPTTKSVDHDRPITAEEIVSENILDQATWDYISSRALGLFQYGQAVADKQNLILVDTKYEFGKNIDDEILLIDECHTPDSSRYWNKENYLERIESGSEPDNFDKEIVRLWYKNQCDPYNDEQLPEAPMELKNKLAESYIYLFEKLTQTEFNRQN